VKSRERFANVIGEREKIAGSSALKRESGNKDACFAVHEESMILVGE
jgi:hypothetical protein